MGKSALACALAALCVLLPGCRTDKTGGAAKPDPAVKAGSARKWVACREARIPDPPVAEGGAGGSGSGGGEGEDASRTEDSRASEDDLAEADTLLVDSCRFGNYLLVDTCSQDRMGRCSWSGSVYAERNGAYVPIRNAEMFNAKLAGLEKRINDSIRAEAKRDLADSENAACFGEEDAGRFDSLPEYSINDFRIQALSEKEMFFCLPTGISTSACAPLWEFIASIPYEDIQPYLK